MLTGLIVILTGGHFELGRSWCRHTSRSFPFTIHTWVMFLLERVVKNRWCHAWMCCKTLRTTIPSVPLSPSLIKARSWNPFERQKPLERELRYSHTLYKGALKRRLQAESQTGGILKMISCCCCCGCRELAWWGQRRPDGETQAAWQMGTVP